MTTTLQKYFPMLKSREEIIEKIYNSEELTEMFESWDEEYQEEFSG